MKKFKKNLFFNYGYDSDFETRAKLIKDCGYDGVFLFADDTFFGAIDACRKNNLDVETIHLPFNTLCNTLWDPSSGDEYVNLLIKWINIARDYHIDKVIFHTSQKPKPDVTEIGKERFKKIVSVCEECKVTLCVENLRHLDLMDLCIGLTDSNYVKACFDCGHANAFTYNINEYDFNKYKDKIVCTHLHDNDGTSDQHLPLFKGNINYKKLMKELRNIDYSGALTLEMIDKVKDASEIEYLKYGIDSLYKLEEYYNEE